MCWEYQFSAIFCVFHIEMTGDGVEEQLASTGPPGLQSAGSEASPGFTTARDIRRETSTAAPQSSSIPTELSYGNLLPPTTPTPPPQKERLLHLLCFKCEKDRFCLSFQVVEVWWQPLRAVSVPQTTLAPTPLTCSVYGWSGSFLRMWSRFTSPRWRWKGRLLVCLTGWRCRSRWSRALWSPGQSGDPVDKETLPGYWCIRLLFAGSVVTLPHPPSTQTAARRGSPSALTAASQALALLRSTEPSCLNRVSARQVPPHSLIAHRCASKSFDPLQGAVLGRSSCATVVAVSCRHLCVTVTQTVTTVLTRQTAATDTRVRACRWALTSDFS